MHSNTPCFQNLTFSSCAINLANAVPIFFCPLYDKLTASNWERRINVRKVQNFPFSLDTKYHSLSFNYNSSEVNRKLQ